MLPVIEVLEELPTVETIDLSDNRLTGRIHSFTHSFIYSLFLFFHSFFFHIDVSLLPLVSKLDKLPHLVRLDFFHNHLNK